MKIKTIEWINNRVRLIDQTRLPAELVYLDIDDYHQLAEAIKRLSVRGAPAIGIAAAYGVVLGLQASAAVSAEQFVHETDEVIAVLAATRPTAVNLFWALARMKKVITDHRRLSVAAIKDLLLPEAHRILREDNEICRTIGTLGAGLVNPQARILTHCNAGGLATGQFGTALAVVYAAHDQGKRISVFADETRPLLQGARLTAWELTTAGIPVTLICDNMAAFVMKQKKVDMVIVGADRITANGDVANKIGTYGLAVLARQHGIPFYVAAPVSTFDLTLANGKLIPIEERAGDEITSCQGRRQAPEGVLVYNPAFDVTEAELVTALITEKGIIENPNQLSIEKIIGHHG
jgi:methylthioribose-1-phosphate isomerase